MKFLWHSEFHCLLKVRLYVFPLPDNCPINVGKDSLRGIIHCSDHGIIFDIYKEELLPEKIVVDMSDVMGDLYKSYGETTKVNLYSIVLQFTDYNKVDEIHVPDEIKNSAK